MIRILFLATLLGTQLVAVFAQTADGQKNTSPQRNADDKLSSFATGEPRMLQTSSPKPVPVPPFAAHGEGRCDSRGNFYFAVGGNTARLGSLLEISHDGAGSTAFTPPTPEKPEPIHELGFRDFAVTPSGTLYELLQNPNDYTVQVVEFDSDGSVKHSTRLETPEELGARSLAVFEDGAFLLRGAIHSKAKEDTDRAYVALFDASGKLTRELTGFPDIKLVGNRISFQDGGLAVGADGNAYLLDADSVTVVSESGKRVRRIPYQKPDPSLVARGLWLSEGLLAMRVWQVRGAEISPRYLVIRADSGETVGYYALSDETDDFGMCFSRNDGFTFLIQLDWKLGLVNAPLR